MTKSGLIEKVAEQTPHISKKDTEVVVNTIFDSMTEALRRRLGCLDRRQRRQQQQEHREPSHRHLPA